MKIAGIILLFFNKTLGFPSDLIDTQNLVDQNDGYPIQGDSNIRTNDSFVFFSKLK